MTAHYLLGQLDFGSTLLIIEQIMEMYFRLDFLAFI